MPLTTHDDERTTFDRRNSSIHPSKPRSNCARLPIRTGAVFEFLVPLTGKRRCGNGGVDDEGFADDAAHQDLSGPAIRRVLHGEYTL